MQQPGYARLRLKRDKKGAKRSVLSNGQTFRVTGSDVESMSEWRRSGVSTSEIDNRRSNKITKETEFDLLRNNEMGKTHKPGKEDKVLEAPIPAIAHPLKFQLKKRGRASTGVFSKSSRENTLRMFNMESPDENDEVNVRLSEASYERDVYNIGRTSSS